MKRVFAVLLALLPCSAFAASAIVHDADNGAYGYSFEQPNVSTAARNAITHCANRSRNCTHLATHGKTGYSALAVGTKAVGYALGKENDIVARDEAIAMCQIKASDCVLKLLWRESGTSPSITTMPPMPPPPYQPIH